MQLQPERKEAPRPPNGRSRPRSSPRTRPTPDARYHRRNDHTPPPVRAAARQQSWMSRLGCHPASPALPRSKFAGEPCTDQRRVRRSRIVSEGGHGCGQDFAAWRARLRAGRGHTKFGKSGFHVRAGRGRGRNSVGLISDFAVWPVLRDGRSRALIRGWTQRWRRAK